MPYTWLANYSSYLNSVLTWAAQKNIMFHRDLATDCSVTCYCWGILRDYCILITFQENLHVFLTSGCAKYMVYHICWKCSHTVFEYVEVRHTAPSVDSVHLSSVLVSSNVTGRLSGHASNTGKETVIYIFRNPRPELRLFLQKVNKHKTRLIIRS